jgi:hypothetical protein
MDNGVLTKSLVFGLLVLLLGTSLIPHTCGQIQQSRMFSEREHQTYSSSPPKEEWNKTFGGENDDFSNEVQQTKDGGFIIGGCTKSFGIALMNPWLIKTDSNGDEAWNRTYPYYSLPFISGNIRSVQQTEDNGYIIGCTLVNESLPIDGFISTMLLIKTDPDGNELWNRTYEGLEYSCCYCVRETSDGGFIATGGGSPTITATVNQVQKTTDGIQAFISTVVKKGSR